MDVFALGLVGVSIKFVDPLIYINIQNYKFKYYKHKVKTAYLGTLICLIFIYPIVLALIVAIIMLPGSALII